MALFDITNEKTGTLLFGINLDADRGVRAGYSKQYTPSGLGTRECVAVGHLLYAGTWPGANTTSVVVSVWSDGSVRMDGAASVATATFTTARWMKLVPVTVPAWDSSSSSWLPKNVMLLYTDSKVYIFDPKTPVAGTYLYDVAVSTPTAPAAGAPSSGRIPAGTYRFVATEITCHGIESLPSTAVTVTSGTAFQAVFTPAAAANTDAVRWRLYMSKDSAVTLSDDYRIVAEAGIASTITANSLPTELGLVYNYGRVALPQTATTGCVHQGVLVSAGDSLNPSSVFVSALSINELGDGLTAFPEVGHAAAQISTTKQLKTVAVVSLNGHLLAFTTNNITGIYGNIVTGEDVQTREIADSIGTRNDRTVAVLGDKVYFTNYDGSRAYVSDGYTVQDITPNKHLLDGLFYALSGNQTMKQMGELQGAFSAHCVVADPYHNKVWFGGEIVNTSDASWLTNAEANNWSAAMIAALPQGGRQYVWRVFDIATTKWLTWTNIPIKAYCIKNGEVWFGDHAGYIWKLNQAKPKDGAADITVLGVDVGVLATKGATATASTTITLTGTWAGTATAGAPVEIINTVTGVKQLRYAVSATSGTLVVDTAVTVTANDLVVYGAPVVDIWTQPLVEPSQISTIDWLILSLSEDARGCVAMLYKTFGSSASWRQLCNWAPNVAALSRIAIGTYCPSMMLRVLLPAVNATAANMEESFAFVLKSLKINGRVIGGGRW